MFDDWYRFPPYVTVAERCARNRKLIRRLERQGHGPEPISVPGRRRKMAVSFWGDRWCHHLESFSDFANRLPRGRSYLRHGAVVDLKIQRGLVTALVNGTNLYRVEVRIDTLADRNWQQVRQACSGQVGSLIELLQGRLSDEVMSVVVDRQQGLLPRPGEIDFSCSCPDWAHMCKHVAAVLFGIGTRLDTQPELLFTLRGVDAQELIGGDLALPEAQDGETALAEEDLTDIFGIEMDGLAEGAAGGPPDVSDKDHRDVAGTDGRQEAGQAPADGVFTPTGPHIRWLRGEFGLTVAEFADVLEVAPATVYRWEKAAGKVRLNLRCRRRLVHLADIRTEVLEGRLPDMPGA